MAGGGKGSSTKPPSSSTHHRKSQPETPHKPSPAKPPPPQQQSSNPKPSPSSNHKPSPKLNPNPIPRPEPFHQPPPFIPPPPAYGFHMLDRRTIVLADGSARSYFALPHDYQDLPPPIRPPDSRLGFDRKLPPGHPIDYRQQNQEYWNSLEGPRKRKFGDDDFARQRQQLLQYGSHNAGPSSREEIRVAKHMRPEGDQRKEIDQAKMKSAFLNFVKVINENANQKKKFLADGTQGSLQCLACTRSKDFPDMHSLIVHTYNPDSSDQVSDHLGLHKAMCILMGWNYLMPPDNSKVYQRFSAEEIAAERDDLIMWPPHVIIRNTLTGKSRDGRMEGLGNKAMDTKLRDFGFTTGKSKAVYGRDGHTGITVVKFASDPTGLKDAMRLADFFEKERRGRRSWASVQPEKDADPNFVKLDRKTGEKERVLYGYLGTAFDLEILDFDTRKKLTIESKKRESKQCLIYVLQLVCVCFVMMPKTNGLSLDPFLFF